MAAPCVADTSFLVSLLDKDDEFHSISVTDARDRERIHIPPVILAETLSFVKYRSGKVATTRDAVRQMAAHANVSLASPEHDHDATMRYWDAHPALSYHDAAAIAAAKRLGVELASYDNAQRKAAGLKPFDTKSRR